PVQTLWASRPLAVRAGRLVAVRLHGEDLRVGLANPNGVRWVRPAAALMSGQAQAWFGDLQAPLSIAVNRLYPRIPRRTKKKPGLSTGLGSRGSEEEEATAAKPGERASALRRPCASGRRRSSSRRRPCWPRPLRRPAWSPC